MIYGITKAVATSMHAQGYPFALHYGPERTSPAAIVDPRIVIERPRGLLDVTHPPQSHALNPPLRSQRTIACRARIFARSTLAGARVQEHEAHAEKAVDMLICALQKVCADLTLAGFSAGSTTFAPGVGGYVPAEDLELEGLETWPGVVYDLPFTVERGVRDTTWADEARDETTDYTYTWAGTCVGTYAPDS